jgi:imidazolonepropionase-like amidohydrolase
VPDMTDVAHTYPIELVGRLTAAVHEAGARVAVHTLLPDAGRFVVAGVDSIEHGVGLDEAALDEMAARGVAWTPTLCAVTSAVDDAAAPPAARDRARAARDRLRELLPRAVSLGVPVLAGTDVVGSLPREVALLADMGLEPAQALAAASDAARRFLGAEPASDVVTYAADPREDPAVLATPVAVVLRGVRVR